MEARLDGPDLVWYFACVFIPFRRNGRGDAPAGRLRDGGELFLQAALVSCPCPCPCPNGQPPNGSRVAGIIGEDGDEGLAKFNRGWEPLLRRDLLPN